MAAKRTTSPGFRDDRYRRLVSRLLERRKALGITQQELADRIGLHKQFVSRVELGERRLDAIEFADFAAALGLSGADLLAEVWEPLTDTEGPTTTTADRV